MVNDMSANGRVRLACEPTVRRLRIEKILPLRRIAPSARTSVKYRRIAASIREVGIIEPLIVHPQKDDDEGRHMLLDGHMRFDVLKELGEQTVDCLIALDDEAFTYNC